MEEAARAMSRREYYKDRLGESDQDDLGWASLPEF